MSRPARARREFAAALLGTAAGAAALLAATGQVWATAEVAVPGPSAPAPVQLAGGDVVPAASAFGWAGLAALAALVAARGWARRAVGGLLALFGAVSLYEIQSGTRPAALTRGAAEQAAVEGQLSVPELHSVWPLLGAAGAVLLLVIGIATMVRGAAWPGMGSRYDRHSPSAAARTGDPADLWKSLDSGADPTADPAPGEPQPGPGTTAPYEAATGDDNADAKEP